MSYAKNRHLQAEEDDNCEYELTPDTTKMGLPLNEGKSMLIGEILQELFKMSGVNANTGLNDINECPIDYIYEYKVDET